MLFRKLHIPDKGVELRYGYRCYFIYIFITHCHCKRLFFQTHSLAFFTGNDAHETLVLLLAPLGSGLAVTALHVFNQPFEGNRVDTASTLPFVMHIDLLVCAVNDNVLYFFGELPERRFQTEFKFLRKRLQNRVSKASLRTAGLPAQNRNRAVLQTHALVGNHQIHVKFHFIAQAKTTRTRAERIVEGKASRLNFADADAAVRAGKALAELNRFAINNVQSHQTFCQRKYILHGIRQTTLDTAFHYKTVHHDFNIVLDIFLNLEIL